MPVVINEVNTEVHAFDPSALVTPEVMQLIVDRVLTELGRRASAERLRTMDREIRDGRRVAE